jgi:transcriptional regulator with XRE-family HTH domain
MSVIDPTLAEVRSGGGVPVKLLTAPRRLHRLAEVRRRQAITRRTLARRLNTDVASVKLLEQPTSDMLLSTLYAWQEVLDVPVAELLVEAEEPLSAPVMKRAQMVRLMKTAGAILERAQQPSIRRMAQMLVDQLCEVMPELKGVSPWHAVGRRRTQDELGQAAYRRFPPEVFRRSSD